MKIVLITGILLFMNSLSYAQDTLRSYSRPTKSLFPAPAISEKQINYPDDVLREELDFNLVPVSEGKFRLNINSQTKGVFFIKVYDVIGNLLYEQKVQVRGNFQQELDMSEHTTNFFIIEVGNEEFNKTKSIVAT